MNHYYQYPPQSLPAPQTPYYAPAPMMTSQLLDAAKTGMMIGGAGTAAMQIYRYQQQQVTLQEAVTETVRGGVYTGLAASAAVAAGSMFKQNKPLSLAASVLAGTAVMYMLNKPKKEG